MAASQAEAAGQDEALLRQNFNRISMSVCRSDLYELILIESDCACAWELPPRLRFSETVSADQPHRSTQLIPSRPFVLVQLPASRFSSTHVQATLTFAPRSPRSPPSRIAGLPGCSFHATGPTAQKYQSRRATSVPVHVSQSARFPDPKLPDPPPQTFRLQHSHAV